MKLGEVARVLGAELTSPWEDLEVGGLAYDSRLVTAGALFFCVEGEAADGHDFAGQAMEKGAVALVVRRAMDLSSPSLVVKDTRKAMAQAAAHFYDHPSKEVDVAAVTGTNGKTTVAFFLQSIFKAAGGSGGLIGTIGSSYNGTQFPVGRTTPEALDLQKWLRDMANAGVRRCAMEVTSIGLDRKRVEEVEFKVAVFTNLTQDHLDYHKDMEAYYQAKKALFALSRSASAAINIDDPHGRRLASEIDLPMTTFGFGSGADVRAKTAGDLSRPGSVYIQGSGLDVHATVNLPGTINIYNALAAAAAAHRMGIDPASVAAGINAVIRVPGRMEKVDRGQDFMVLVDYAHTPDGLESVLRAAGELTTGRVISVFGCGGDRDRGKRELMGRAAASLSDIAIVTSDNPRSEHPGRIIKQIEKGLRSAGAHEYLLVEDRADAIKQAISLAHAGDVVVIAGKGHETMQEFADHSIAFDDRLVAAAVLDKRS